MPRIAYHVVPSEGRWAVKREGADRAVRFADEQAEAVTAAERMARRQAPARVVIHGPDGLIQTVHSFEAVPSERGRDWLGVVRSKPALVLVGVVALVAVGYGLRNRL
jgi:hypothetical protein